MIKKLLLTSFFLLGIFVLIYPSEKENTKIDNYCYSLEKIITRNSIKTKKKVSRNLRSLSNDIAEFGIRKSQGLLINRMIDQYKNSKKSIILNLFPNKLYCLSGYWIENIRPGTFESIIYEKSKNKIIELKDLKEEVDIFLNDFNSEYKIIKEEFNNLFN
tara:strand:+ start:807 stop:1286 length:480 start_codon:yes stop_codon:yes gene_type:complete